MLFSAGRVVEDSPHRGRLASPRRAPTPPRLDLMIGWLKTRWIHAASPIRVDAPNWVNLLHCLEIEFSPLAGTTFARTLHIESRRGLAHFRAVFGAKMYLSLCRTQEPPL
jgi:hypothetical protein